MKKFTNYLEKLQKEKDRKERSEKFRRPIIQVAQFLQINEELTKRCASSMLVTALMFSLIFGSLSSKDMKEAVKTGSPLIVAENEEILSLEKNPMMDISLGTAAVSSNLDVEEFEEKLEKKSEEKEALEKAEAEAKREAAKAEMIAYKQSRFKAEAEKRAKEEARKQAEAEAKAKAEAEAKAKAEAEAQAQAEAEAKAKAEAEAAANNSWGGQKLTPRAGTVHGPSGKETYYNLDMSGVVSIMRRMGNNDEYWVRSDGVKMLGQYVMVAANLNIRPRGSLVPTSLGTGIVCDTGGFAASNPTQLDIAVTW